MNIYTLKSQDDKLKVSFDLTEFLSIHNKELEMLTKVMRTSINRHFSLSLSYAETNQRLHEIMEFPLTASMYEFTVSYNKDLMISVKNFHIPNTNLSSSINYN